MIKGYYVEYKNIYPELRERIETLRQQQAQEPTSKQIKREMNENMNH